MTNAATSSPAPSMSADIQRGSARAVYLRGTLYCLAASVSFGLMFPVMSSALSHVDPFTFTSLRYLIAAAISLVLLRIKEGPDALNLKGEPIALAWLLGSIGFAGFGFLVFLGQQLAGRDGALTTSIMAATQPLLGILIISVIRRVLPPPVTLLLVLLSLFGWIGLSDYVRAEFLRNRTQDYVRAARAMGLSNWQIIWRHVLPNSLTPVITFLPFRMSGAILALTSLDFLGLGVPPPTPSLGELLAQGKGNLDAWWISLSTFGVLVTTLLLLTFMGDALRNALDTRIADAARAAGGQR